MPKSAILSLDREDLLTQTNFKQLALYFDSVYVNDRTLQVSTFDIKMSKSIDPVEKDRLLAEIDWLQQAAILQSYTIPSGDFNFGKIDPVLGDDMGKISKEIFDRLVPADIDIEANLDVPIGELRPVGSRGLTNDLKLKMQDIRLRIDALQLEQDHYGRHFVPLVNSFSSYYGHHSKDYASHFVLSKIPFPDDTTSWEQIIEFRSDDAVKRKYYALLQWANTIGNQEIPVAQIADQYNQLYSEYTHQYTLHKISSKLTTLELLIMGSVGVISSLVQQDFVTAFKGLIHFRKERVGLLQAEKGIEGRELAYIFTAKEKFES